MRQMSFLALLAAITLATTSRADPIAQTDQVVFGISGAYVPQQNGLQGDAVGLGHYVAYSHSLDSFYVGFRLAILYAWFPSGAPGQQWLLEPDAFLGIRANVAKPLALRLEVGAGPLVNGGEGFSTVVSNHTYVRAAAQVTVVKSLLIEAFVGPSFILGSPVGVFGEAGVGFGWKLPY
jgi:hypothetical protein